VSEITRSGYFLQQNPATRRPEKNDGSNVGLHALVRLHTGNKEVQAFLADAFLNGEILFRPQEITQEVLQSR
jgi:hypothetical protein